MIIKLIAIGKRVPHWVNQGFYEYASRLKTSVKLELIEIDAVKRGSNLQIEKIIEEEGRRLLKAAPNCIYKVALDEKGDSCDSLKLSMKLDSWKHYGQDVALLVGGPDGLSEEVINKVNFHWSLSKLTLAHHIVRIVIAEQIYRANSILEGLPYHRNSPRK